MSTGNIHHRSMLDWGPHNLSIPGIRHLTSISSLHAPPRAQEGVTINPTQHHHMWQAPSPVKAAAAPLSAARPGGHSPTGPSRGWARQLKLPLGGARTTTGLTPTSHLSGGFSATSGPSQIRPPSPSPPPHSYSPTAREQSDEPSRLPRSPSRSSPFPSEGHFARRYRNGSRDDDSVTQIPSVGTRVEEDASTIGAGSDVDAEIEALEDAVETTERKNPRPPRQRFHQR